MWANQFVRERLWSGGVWHAAPLAEASLDVFVQDRMRAQANARVKCRNNDRHLFELCGYLPALLNHINSGSEDWIGSALLLAWDRHILDGNASARANLIDLIRAEELYKLLGVTEPYAINLARDLIEFYLRIGNI
jgi:hypothetical protein